MVNTVIAVIIIVILGSIFWRFVLGIPFGYSYRCPECGRLLTKPFTYRVERCPSCNIKIDWKQLIESEDY